MKKDKGKQSNNNREIILYLIIKHFLFIFTTGFCFPFEFELYILAFTVHLLHFTFQENITFYILRFFCLTFNYGLIIQPNIMQYYFSRNL